MLPTPTARTTTDKHDSIRAAANLL
jgi:hypothetical protein